MSDDAPAPPAYKDRTVGLIAFGILELLLGCACAVLLPLSLLSTLLTRTVPTPGVPPPEAGSLLFDVVLYGLVSAFFIAMGIGSIRARRWARTLMLVASWFVLVVGAAALLSMLFLFPILRSEITRAAGPRADLPAVYWILGATLLVFYVIVPATFLLFYRSPHVKATVEAKDPNIPWTDRCPEPVLAASLLVGWGGLCFLLVTLGYRVLVFFVVWTGLPAVALGLGLATAWLFAAADLYRQRMRGWWIAFGTSVAFAASGLVLFLTGFDAVTMYEAMGYPREMAERMGGFAGLIRWSFLVGGPLWVGFLLWVRRYMNVAPARG